MWGRFLLRKGRPDNDVQSYNVNYQFLPRINLCSVAAGNRYQHQDNMMVDQTKTCVEDMHATKCFKMVAVRRPLVGHKALGGLT